MAESVKAVVSPTRVSRSEIASAIAQADYVVIGGAGLTGKAAAKYFKNLGKLVIPVIDQPNTELAGEKLIATAELEAELKKQKGKGIALFSPGIAPGGQMAEIVFKSGLKSLSELDLLCEEISEPLVAVTGTNGKSTTVTLITQMLLHSEVQAELIGNIGVPFIDALNLFQKGENRNYIAEVSSYQLEWAERVSPHVALFLNLAENHLERHLTMENYLNSKLKILSNQKPDDYSIINSDDPFYPSALKASTGRVVSFGVSSTGQNRSMLSADGKTLEVIIDQERYYFVLDQAKLLGFHNRMNFAAAIPAALICGASQAGIYEVIRNFGGLEHRLEFVPNKKGLKIINDSKATTAHAAASDLSAVLGSAAEEVTLLVGGLEKVGSWNCLSEVLRSSKKVKAVLFFGKDGQGIMRQIKEAEVGCHLEYAGSLAESLKAAVSNATSNDLILFSPGCPSFDAYSGFEERGRHFKSLVSEIVQ